MAVSLGLDIGSNSVGSAWVDTEAKTIDLGVSVFPAGVDETDTKRGAPINQKRRQKRQQRRSLARRAARKRALRNLLTEVGLLPAEPQSLSKLFSINPWLLRREAVRRALTPHEFGRVLVHLNQRRGAIGITTDPEDPDEGKVKEAIDRCRALMQERKAETFGQLIADLMDERRRAIPGKPGTFYQDPVRNRQYRIDPAQQLYADRAMIRDEFAKLWDGQAARESNLGQLLKNVLANLRNSFDDSTEDDIWRHRGVIFGQRRTYWDVGTLGRCQLEPTARCVPVADMYAQHFRILETVNNIRIEERGKPPRPLCEEERSKVIAALRKQRAGSVATVRKALGVDKKAVREFFALNIERDEDREINTDWFYREIVHAVFTEELWKTMTESQRQSVNRAILKFNPDTDGHSERLGRGAIKWWGLSSEAADRLVVAWRTRPRLEKRLNLSREAVLNLLPYMDRLDALQNRWPTQIEARQAFAEDGDNDATDEQRRRYGLGTARLRKADRHFLRKHPGLLPPAPVMANPVVRKAIHEVRRHISSYLQKFGRKPDRIVIELARSATQSEKVRNRILANNRMREAERKKIVEDFDLRGLTFTQQFKAVERVLLCREQRTMCAYSGRTITERMAAVGEGLETDHIVPQSRTSENGLSNKVLCFRESNRGKGNLTPKEWLPEHEFERMLQRFAHWKKECPRKWENINRDAPSRDQWVSSQLTDTAYAATQVGSYLSAALYGDESDGERRVFFTKGAYTAILRRDWQLIDDDGPKKRSDHRHHALDAAVIALTDPKALQDLARHAEEQEKAKAKEGKWPARKPLDPPWGSVCEFRAEVMQKLQTLTVAHRPVKRKVSGYLHKEDLWGAVDEDAGVFRIRCQVKDLNPKMLRKPVRESDAEVRSRCVQELVKAGLPVTEARKQARQLVDSEQFKKRLVDPSLGKGGLVRDWGIRKIIRNCLRSNGIDPDHFTPKQMSDFVATGRMRMPSGVPIKSVITIGPISDPVKIAVRDPYTRKQAINLRTGRPLYRFHISRNNHHMEILEDPHTGAWSDEVVTVFQAAQRIRPSKDLDGKRQQSKSAVDRSDREGKRFIMSLSEGETVYMRHPKTGAGGYFVVFKLSPKRIFFIHHWDARRSVFEQDHSGNVIPGTKREEIDVTPADFKNLGPEPGQPPCKVGVSPLGEIRRMERD